MKSVYIHIPFCKSICTYCDFCKIYYDKSLVKQYLKTLSKEIQAIYKNEPIKTLYIGGGTPSALDIDELNLLFEMLEIFDKSKIEEYTIECNIETLTKEKLLLFKNKGISRLSIGVQTFNEKLLELLGRNHTKDMVIDTINVAKEVGFNNISVDLIYGIKGTTLEDLKQDIDIFLKLDISHVSFYSLIIEPHTKLYLDDFDDIDEDLNLSMYNYINKTLKSYNYDHYEISNYAKQGYESCHNLVYWHNEEYYGFGLGASSFIGKRRYENTRSLNNYLDDKYILYEETLDDKQMMENEMILGLRLTKGVNKKRFLIKYNKRIEDVFPIKDLISKQLLLDNNDNVSIPDDKLFVSNSILIEFLD